MPTPDLVSQENYKRSFMIYTSISFFFSFSILISKSKNFPIFPPFFLSLFFLILFKFPIFPLDCSFFFFLKKKILFFFNFGFSSL